MPPEGKTYEDGLVEGKLHEHSTILAAHHDRMDSHSKRITPLERVAWMGIGAIVVIQVVIPLVQYLNGV